MWTCKSIGLPFLRVWFWALFLPLLAVIGLVPTQGLSIFLLLTAYILLVYRVYRMALDKDFKSKDAISYALFCGVLDKYPKLFGQWQFFIFKLLKRQRTIVEYKNTVSAN